MSIYGIDLGTSNCLVARVVQGRNQSIRIECLDDNEGREEFPSIVSFRSDEEYIVGHEAADKLIKEPDNTVELIKVRLGNTKYIEFKIGTEKVKKTPQQITSCVLKHFNKLHNDRIQDIVLTVPAYFKQPQRESTIQAAELAGLNVKEKIAEPTAAIMYHLFYQYQQNGDTWLEEHTSKNILVFDFGGGTLDLSLIEVKKDGQYIDPKVIQTEGDSELGGNNIDFVFTKVVLEVMEANYGDDPYITQLVEAYNDYYDNYINHHTLRFRKEVPIEMKESIFRLKRQVESAKIKLSTMQEQQISLGGKYEAIKVKRKEFEESVLNHPDLNLSTRIGELLEKFSRLGRPVYEVLLVGGSSQIPMIQDIIKAAFEKHGLKKEKIITCHEYDKAVVKGAAISAAITEGIPIPPFNFNKCKNIVAMDIEIEDMNLNKHDVFIKQGTEYPFACPKSFKFKVGHALSEKVDIKLNELKTNRNGVTREPICTLNFYLPIYYTGDEIEVSMQINEKGIYEIKGIHIPTHEKIEYEPHNEYVLSEQDMKKIAEDMKRQKDISYV